MIIYELATYEPDTGLSSSIVRSRHTSILGAKSHAQMACPAIQGWETYGGTTFYSILGKKPYDMYMITSVYVMECCSA